MSKNETTREGKSGAEQAQQAQKSPPGEPVHEFRSRYTRFRILLKSPRYNERGKMIEPGRRIEFNNHVFTTSDAGLAAELRALPGFGRDFDEINTQAVQKAIGTAA